MLGKLFERFIWLFARSDKENEDLDNWKQEPIDDSRPFIYFHEDDYCQIELLHVADLDAIEMEMKGLIRFREDNFNENGFNQILVMNNKSTLLDLLIKPEELDEIYLVLGYPRCDQFKNSHGRSFTPGSMLKNMVAFGESWLGVFYDYNNGIVNHIWFNQLFRFDQNIVLECFQRLSQKWNLVLVDWNKCVVVEISDQNALLKYFEEA